MNTFAVLLLAFPFYLATKGRLSAYIALAKPDASSNSTPQGTASTATSSNSASSSDYSNVVSIFKNTAMVASLA